MTSRHSRLVEYFITVGIDFDNVAPINDDSIANPIRELRIISDRELIPDGFDMVRTTITGKDASLSKKGIIQAVRSYLCYSREGDGETLPFTRIAYMKAKNVNAQDWHRCPGKLMSANTEYCLCVKTDSTVPPIADICIITTDGSEQCPDGYYKLPHTINNHFAICFRHLPMDALGLRYQTCIIDRYPRQDYTNSPLSNTVAVFCQPSGADLRSELILPTFLSFVLTDAEGHRMYAITVTFYDEINEDNALQIQRSLDSIYTDGFKPRWPSNAKKLYHSKSVCILSYYPFFQSFRECLKEIYRVANSGGKIPIERYIVNLTQEVPLPIPDQQMVQLLYAHKPITFRLPSDNELPILDVDVKKVFQCLSLAHVLLIFQVLVTQEHKILFTSTHISLITEVCEAFSSFLTPFAWEFTYVPVLPYSVFSILDAPVPLICGMHTSRVKPDYYSSQRETVIINLDTNAVHIPPHLDFIDIPNALHKPLRSELKHHSHCTKVDLFNNMTIQHVDNAFTVDFGDNNDNQLQFAPLACQSTFLMFWIRVMGPDYKTFLKFPDDTNIFDFCDLFDTDAFIESRPKALKKFLTAFTVTQGFMKFVEDLTFDPSPDRVIQLQSFYKCTQHEYQYYLGADIFKVNKNMDAFSIWLRGRRPELRAFQVPSAYADNVGADYKFDPQCAFPLLKDEHFNEPRITNLVELVMNSSERAPNTADNNNNNSDNNNNNNSHKTKNSDGTPFTVTVNSERPVFDQRGGRGGGGGRSRGNRSQAKFQTPLDRAKFLLLQVYGFWFAAHVASLDFKDIPAAEVEEVVVSTLELLYAMSDPRSAKDIALIPDELIYKACLILCGKFNRKKQASKIFQDLKANGITPSQKTYGAYTNAMASSGANMLLSAGSMSSGRSSNFGRSFDHRRSFVPSHPSDQSLKSRHGHTRSMSGAFKKRLLTEKQFETINEDDEINEDGDVVHKGGRFPPKMASSPIIGIGTIFEEHKHTDGVDNGAQKSVTISEESAAAKPVTQTQKKPGFASSVQSTDVYADTENTNHKPSEHNTNKNKQHHNGHGNAPKVAAHKSISVTIAHSTSSPTNTPRTDIDPPAYARPPLRVDTGGLPVDEEEESKSSAPMHAVSPTTSVQLSSLSSEATPLEHISSIVSETPEPNAVHMVDRITSRDTGTGTGTGNGNGNEETKESRDTNAQEMVYRARADPSKTSASASQMDKIATIIDFGTLEMSTAHQCECGYILSDAHILVCWCSEFSQPSGHITCVMCRQNTFEPTIRVKYHTTRMSMQNGICSFQTESKKIKYLSPLTLRTTINFILHHRRLDFEDPELFREKHEHEFWNLIWYCFHRKLDLTFLLGKHDSNAVNITVPVQNFRRFHRRKSNTRARRISQQNINTDTNDAHTDAAHVNASHAIEETEESEVVIERLLPQSDDVLANMLRPIYKKAVNGNIKGAMSQWLVNRSSLSSKKREKSIWNLSVFDSFHDLQIPSHYQTYRLFIKEFRSACHTIRPKMKDRAWDDPVLAIQRCFKHPRISNQRLSSLISKLKKKPPKPRTPVPKRPSKSSKSSKSNK